MSDMCVWINMIMVGGREGGREKGGEEGGRERRREGRGRKEVGMAMKYSTPQVTPDFLFEAAASSAVPIPNHHTWLHPIRFISSCYYARPHNTKSLLDKYMHQQAMNLFTYSPHKAIAPVSWSSPHSILPQCGLQGQGRNPNFQAGMFQYQNIQHYIPC